MWLLPMIDSERKLVVCDCFMSQKSSAKIKFPVFDCDSEVVGSSRLCSVFLIANRSQTSSAELVFPAFNCATETVRRIHVSRV